MDLQFKPAHSGMGFHPNPNPPKERETLPVKSMALPVLPARPATMRAPMSPAATQPVPVARQNPAPIQTRAPQSRPAAATIPIITESTPNADIAATVGQGNPFGIVYSIKRIVAYILDVTLNVGLCIAALETVMLRQGLEINLLFSGSTLWLSLAFIFVFQWSVITIQEVAFHTTVGKRMFGLVFDGSTSKILLRSVLFMLSLMLCGVGLLWALANRRRRCWHDGVVDLQPVEVATL